MKNSRYIQIFFAIFFAFSSSAAFADGESRKVVSLNRGWMFHQGDSSHLVNLPHDFQIEQPWVAPAANEKADNSDAGANIQSRQSGRGFKEMSEGWYEKTFTPSIEDKGKRITLDFQGMMYMGDVYLNGKHMGSTDYGYLGFEVNATYDLKYGEPNTIKVVCNTGKTINSRWYTGGGLFRDVNYVATDSLLYFLRNPLHITTTGNRYVNISALVRCKNHKANTVVRAIFIAPDGSIANKATFIMKNNKNYHHGEEYKLPAIEIKNPQLWDCEHPNLYKVFVQLIRPDKSVSDQVSATFGFRTIEIGPEFGLKLNGKKVLLKGVAGHSNLGALGAAAYPRAIEKRIQLLKSFGVNHIRTSHNPYSDSFLDLCDKYGILVLDELYDKWVNKFMDTGRASFKDLWQDNLQEFVTRDRNHPCIFAWSMGNELQQYSSIPHNDFGVTQFLLMKTLLKRYDDTRKVTVAMHPRYRNWNTDSLPCDLAKVTDFQAYNYRYKYFPLDGKNFPWMTFYQSEATTLKMGENYFDMDLNKVIGLAYWGAIDYLGESQGWPAKGFANGVFDIALNPKPKAYLMKSIFKEDEPLVHIAIRDAERGTEWNGIKTGCEIQSDTWNRTPDEKLHIVTYTNADEVELLVNGKSCGTKKNNISDPKTRNIITWDSIEYQNGYCEAIARTNGMIVARHKIETAGKAVKLILDQDNSDWKADGTDLQHIRIIAVDAKGRKVPSTNSEVNISITGDATIAAMGNGNIYSDELNVTDHQALYNGSCLAILRSGINPSNITITASAPDLKTAKLKLTTR